MLGPTYRAIQQQPVKQLDVRAGEISPQSSNNGCDGAWFLMLKFSTRVLAAGNMQVPQATLCCCGRHVGNINVLQKAGCVQGALIKVLEQGEKVAQENLGISFDGSEMGQSSRNVFSIHSTVTAVLGVAIQMWMYSESFAVGVRLERCHL